MILFRKRTPVKKLQAGGSVPYYQRFDVQMRPEGTAANIGVMMDKHGKPKTKGSAKGDAKIDSPYKDIKGLQIDKEAYMTKMKKLQEEQQFLMRNDPEGYSGNARFQAVSNQIDMMASSELDRLAQEYEDHKEAKTRIRDGGYGDQWIMQNGVGVVRNRKTDNIENIPARYINAKDSKGNPIYDKIMYKDGIDIRDNDKSRVKHLDGTIGSMIVAGDFTNKLASGISTANAYKNLIETVYTNIGYDKKSEKITYKNTQVGEEMMDQYMKSSGKKSNARQLQEAFKTMIPRIESSPGWNALMADAYLSGAESDAEAQQFVLKQLSANLASKLEVDIEGEQLEDIPEIEDPTTGLGGDKWKKQPAMLDAHKGSTDRGVFIFDLDAKEGAIFNLNDKNLTSDQIDRTTALKYNIDVELKKQIDKQSTLSDQSDDVKSVVRFNKGRFFTGDALSGTITELDPSFWNPFKAGKSYSLLDSAIIDKDEDIKLAHMAVNERTGAVADIKGNPAYEEMLKVIETEGLESAVADAELPSAKAEARRNLNKIEQIYYQKIANGYDYQDNNGKIIHVDGVNIQKVAIMKIITNREDMQINGVAVDEDHPLWGHFEKVTDTGKIEDFITAVSREWTDKGKKKYEGGTDIANRESEDWVSTYIYAPYTESFSTIVRSDQDASELWVPLEAMTYANVTAKHNRATVGGVGRRASGKQVENIVK